MPHNIIKDYGLKRLAKREYSVSELRQKMLNKFPEQSVEIEPILEAFQNNGWLSDDRFCEAFIRHQLLTTKAGPKMIQMKLIQKGIEAELAEKKVREHFSVNFLQEQLSALAIKKSKDLRKRKPQLTPYIRKQKVVQFLLGKGYTYDMIKKIEPDIV